MFGRKPAGEPSGGPEDTDSESFTMVQLSDEPTADVPSTDSTVITNIVPPVDTYATEIVLETTPEEMIVDDTPAENNPVENTSVQIFAPIPTAANYAGSVTLTLPIYAEQAIAYVARCRLGIKHSWSVNSNITLDYDGGTVFVSLKMATGYIIAKLDYPAETFLAELLAGAEKIYAEFDENAGFDENMLGETLTEDLTEDLTIESSTEDSSDDSSTEDSSDNSLEDSSSSSTYISTDNHFMMNVDKWNKLRQLTKLRLAANIPAELMTAAESKLLSEIFFSHYYESKESSEDSVEESIGNSSEESFEESSAKNSFDDTINCCGGCN